MRCTRDAVGNARSSLNDGFIEGTLATLLVICAACVAAVIAHVVIDIVGDFVLDRDAYDNAAHASRFIALVVALFGGLALVWQIVASAVAEARGHERFLRIAAERAVRGSAGWFIGRVTVTGVVVLAIMSLLDLRLDGLPLDDIGDLFGGSSAVGLSVSLLSGTAVGAVVLRLARWIAMSHRTIVAAVIACISWIVHRHGGAAGRVQRSDHFLPVHRCGGALARRAGKRAPPPLFA